MFVQVVVNIPRVSGVFDYHVPDPLLNKVKPGSLVEVPFGRQTVQGVVLREITVPQVPDTRPIFSLIDPQPVTTPLQIALAEVLAKDTYSSLAVCMGLMIPPGLRKQADVQYLVTEEFKSAPAEALQSLTQQQQRLLNHLNRPRYQEEGLRGRQLDSAFRHVDWRRVARTLEKKGWIYSYPVLPPPSVKPKTVRTAQLACSPEQVETVENLGKGAAGERRRKILQFLVSEPWPVEVSWVYAASEGNLQDLRRLAEMGLITLGESEVMRDPLEGINWIPPQIPQLTRDQQSVWDTVREAVLERKTRHPVLLHGVTGSGKTEIYLRAVDATLQQGRSAIILVPEIALTPQTVRRFLSRFPGQVGLIHSRLSEGERYDTWRRIRAGSLKVVVGPRSALFSPLPDPGLIVVDECHDDSYYQGDPQPYYHGVKAAIRYGHLANALVILGSATPQIDLYQRARARKWTILHMPQRILAHRQSVQAQMERIGRNLVVQLGEGDSTVLPLPRVRVVDMRQELKAGNRSIFSRSLQDAIKQTLANDQQAILFLNRRGRATYVFCRDCGYSLKCPRCDLPLTYHTQGSTGLVCHTCGYRREMPSKCPQCGSTYIRHFGTGTEKVEAELKEAFPSARVLRWDAGTTRTRDSHEIILSHFSNHRADILVGTQMLAKGLDLPLVTLVGVVLAEVGLNFPDFRAGERTFQLLTQVAGRAGRSPLGGRVILQTFQPEHYVIQAASRHDFDGFFKQELHYRKVIGYPPFSRLLRLEYRHQKNDQAQFAAQYLAAEIRQWLDAGDFRSTEMIGPVPCFFGKIKGYYRWQILLRGPDPLQVITSSPHAQTVLGDWRVEVDPLNLL
jgi:primosomal protein N' (replication factor Y)